MYNYIGKLSAFIIKFKVSVLKLSAKSFCLRSFGPFPIIVLTGPSSTVNHLMTNWSPPPSHFFSDEMATKKADWMPEMSGSRSVLVWCLLARFSSFGWSTHHTLRSFLSLLCLLSQLKFTCLTAAVCCVRYREIFPHSVSCMRMHLTMSISLRCYKCIPFIFAHVKLCSHYYYFTVLQKSVTLNVFAFCIYRITNVRFGLLMVAKTETAHFQFWEYWHFHFKTKQCTDCLRSACEQSFYRRHHLNGPVLCERERGREVLGCLGKSRREDTWPSASNVINTVMRHSEW